MISIQFEAIVKDDEGNEKLISSSIGVTGTMDVQLEEAAMRGLCEWLKRQLKDRKFYRPLRIEKITATKEGEYSCKSHPNIFSLL